MTLKLVDMTEADTAEFVNVFSSAFAGGPVNRAMLPLGNTPEYLDFLVQRELKTFHKRNHWRLAVVDSDTSEFIGVALWSLEDEVALNTTPEPRNLYPKGNAEAKTAFTGMIRTARHAVMGKERTYWHLNILATRPGHERKGAGRMLLKWGTDKADKDGLDTFLDATPVGRTLYEKFGFSVVREQDLDLSPYGVPEVYHSASMVRPPQGQQPT
ncbi:hypothetical protein FH972_022146 [Carpinus fangiana]|uniref:N-acetyltransferase domain-containing protein n=1 Tax=Carpinus fangiana TaxID=176857 RepID=A0A5N6KRE1_9ROSI|nr:hypothetical protein FH972_022146 [Carpinus fangiana]